MKIAEEYFERLLRPDGPVGAITQLDQVWCSRPGVSKDIPRFGLEEPEYNIHLVLLYTGAVSNGGNAQFFEGPLAELATDTVGALDAMGLAVLAEALRLALRRTISYDDADKLADRELPSVNAALLAYARKYESELCRPERGSPTAAPQ
jgi:hypothetical protein